LDGLTCVDEIFTVYEDIKKGNTFIFLDILRDNEREKYYYSTRSQQKKFMKLLSFSPLPNMQKK
jgi:hypothetical protein